MARYLRLAVLGAALLMGVGGLVVYGQSGIVMGGVANVAILAGTMVNPDGPIVSAGNGVTVKITRQDGSTVVLRAEEMTIERSQ